MEIPENFKIFFMNGGACLQFSAVCYNLLRLEQGATANFLTTGYWTDLAVTESRKYCEPNEVWRNQGDNFETFVEHTEWNIDPAAKYFHYCDNETIQGFEFNEFPYESVPEGQVLVSDMSSNFCSKRIDWSKYGAFTQVLTKTLVLPAYAFLLCVRICWGKKGPILHICAIGTLLPRRKLNFLTRRATGECMFAGSTWLT